MRLKSAAQPEFAGLELERDILFGSRDGRDRFAVTPRLE